MDSFKCPDGKLDFLFHVSVFLDGLFCSLFELISSDVKQPELLSQLLLEIKNKEVVSFYFIISLLILLGVIINVLKIIKSASGFILSIY